MRLHLLIHSPLGFFALGRHPLCSYVGLDFLEVGNMGGGERVDEHEVPAVTRLDRSLPRVSLLRKERARETWSKRLGQFVKRAVAIIILKHERLGESRRLWRARRFAS